MCHIFFNHSFVGGHLGWLHCVCVCVCVNSAAINMGEQVSLLYADFISFSYILGNEVAGLYGSSIFSFLRNPHRAFHSGYMNLRVSFSPQSHQHLLFWSFLKIAILTGIRWDLSEVWFAFPWWLKTLSIPFIYLLPICTSFENSVQIIFPLIDWITCSSVIHLFCFVISSLHTLGINSL